MPGPVRRHPGLELRSASRTRIRRPSPRLAPTPAEPPRAAPVSSGGGRRLRDGATWLGVFAAILTAVSALVFNVSQLELGRQGLFTDRYGKAVVNLGDASADVRLGAVLELRSLGADPRADRRAIVEVLSAFAQHHVARPPGPPPFPARPMSPELRTALNVVGHLGGADLPTAFMTGAALGGANLHDADLTGANLGRADLTRADLTGATLTGATLSNADLAGANLHGANLHGAYLVGANLAGVDLAGADLGDANLTGATGR
ncbi:MAG: hypothetical protein JWM15_3792 [Cryptosporangiaceae bacterium]|nr:hypothetical protein [Cryptosporangiaceae bacterium]